MRFLANENFPRAAVEALRVAGHDVSWVRTEAPGVPDTAVLDRARGEQRVLLTFDKDFGELALKRGATASHGAILFRIPGVPSRGAGGGRVPLDADIDHRALLAALPGEQAIHVAEPHREVVAHRDIVVIGASTGGVELLLDLVSELPAKLPAAIFVVLHTAPGYLSTLPELLSNRGAIPAIHPQHGDEVVPGRIYVAPPDNHLLLRPGLVEVVRGPKENGHRPAVDPLFRTASWSYGSRVVGVVLSGFLDCGTAGLMSVKARGGIAVVQDPGSATAPDMPRSALARVAVDHVIQPAELPGLLIRLASEQAPPSPPHGEAVDKLEGTRLGSPAELVCPLCHGVLTEVTLGEFRHYRCHVGHAFSLDSLLGEQSEDVERALWAAVRSLEEGAALSGRLHRAQRNKEMRQRFTEKEKNLMRQAEVIRRILLREEPRLDEAQGSTEAYQEP